MTAPTDLEKLAEDWITLWQSELSGMAADPELAEAWAAAVALGAAWWRAQGMAAGRAGMFPAMPAGLPIAPFPWPGAAANPWFGPSINPWAGAADDDPAAAGAADAPRPAPAGAAPDGQRDAGGGGIEPHGAGDGAMAARLAELERRLAAVESGAGGDAPDSPAPRRRKRRA